MDCPFSLEIDDPEDNEDPEKDEDEDEMIDKKQDGVKPSEDFSVPQKPPQLSKFDETLSAEEREAREAKWVRENTIDDDQPDFEKEDEYDMRKERIHCWILL